MVGEGMKIFLQVDGMLTEVMTVMSASYHLKYAHRTIQQWCDEGRLIAWNFEGRWLIDAVQVKSLAIARDGQPQNVAS
jgi:hypothetical protein